MHKVTQTLARRHMTPKTDLKEGDDAVPSDGLQQPRGTSEALKPRPTAGEKRANHNDPRRRPGQNTEYWDLFH